MINEGICLYSIESDGCLNGVYTNEHRTVVGEIYNEVARIQDKKKLGKDGLSGVYDCFYFDLNNVPTNAVLEITNKGRVYNFKWIVAGKPLFEGTGYKMNETQVAVHYIEV